MTDPSTAAPAPSQLPHVLGPSLRSALSPTAAVEALERALREGLDPETDAPRTRVETSTGMLMQMPSTRGEEVGTKLLTLTPENADADLPVIQGVYVLFGGAEQAPRAVLDGIELTNLRTSSVSALGARLAGAVPAGSSATGGTTTAAAHLVLFGTGVQAWEHAVTFCDVLEVERITVVGRSAEKAQALAARITDELGVSAEAGGEDAVAEADVVVTCTASASPLFDGALVRDDAVVVAMGAHTPDTRELDEALLARGQVVVESRDSALREAGEVVLGMESGAVTEPELVTFADLATGRARRKAGVPAVVVTTGMPWQDLVVASAVMDALEA
ncbi:ornithine cyclodeaminase family protein [Micrococcus sp. FDAARGOS_333]|uniref:ornithine cyclodeaminase family protein n=1 Tax=Micrococcus sp. FDAARGOS_333 TaxID=1930558 RepID=UPI000B4E3D6D|nr:ornithine cyclodeaminase family protein [Micrococcus sp. FDAARGOS_333]PNL17266.1 ornithine cyclodeaminase [Micrococcus sp. FDAARGOS_333]